MDRFSDLQVFLTIVQQGSLAGAAQALGLSAPAVSRRLAALEARLGVRLLQRTTRSLRVTPEGEAYRQQGQRIAEELDALEAGLRGTAAAPGGLLRVHASLGFGRRHVAPLLADFSARHPQVEVQLQLTDRLPDLVAGGFDLSVHVGTPPDARLALRRLAPNRRLLCAAPAYLRQHGVPARLEDLRRHQAIVIRESDDTYGQWTLQTADTAGTVKVGGALSTNDGETALQWALAGRGIVLRSQWDAAPYLAQGALQQVLPAWSAPADVYALFPHRAALPQRTRFLLDYLADTVPAVMPAGGLPGA